LAKFFGEIFWRNFLAKFFGEIFRQFFGDIILKNHDIGTWSNDDASTEF
jgi:hypothetical protein